VLVKRALTARRVSRSGAQLYEEPQRPRDEAAFNPLAKKTSITRWRWPLERGPSAPP
jgi:hypothetical protein